MSIRHIAIAICLLPFAAFATPDAHTLPPVVIESAGTADSAEPSQDFIKATRMWLKEDDARSLARQIMRQDSTTDIAAPAAKPEEPPAAIQQLASLPVPKAKENVAEQAVEVVPPDNSAAKPTRTNLESVYVEPHKVIEKSRFDGMPEHKGKPISEAIAEDRSRNKNKEDDTALKIATPVSKPDIGKLIKLDALPDLAARPSNPKAKVIVVGQKQQEVQTASIDNKQQIVRTQPSAGANEVIRSPDATIIKGNQPRAKNLAMVPLTPNSYIIPPDMEQSAQQLASVAPAAGPRPSKIPAIGKITYSVFTSNVVDRSPQGRIARASVSQGTLTYFSVVENLQGQYLVHRWEHDGKVLFDKPFAVSNSPSSAWSSLPLSPDVVGNITVKTMDQSGHVLGSDKIEVVP